MFASRNAWKLSPNRLAAALERCRQNGKAVLDLTISNPTTVGFRLPEAAIRDSLSRPEVLEYSPQAKGRLSARQAVADYYGGRGDTPPDPEDIVLTASTSEGYSFVFRLLCEPGDEVLVPSPSYPLFEYLASLADVQPVHYPLLYDHGWHIDLHSLGKAVTSRTRAIIVVHPNNPTGSYVSETTARELNKFCVRRKLALIVDEVFLDYQLMGDARRSFVGNKEVLTFTLSGLSKIVALPQMKLAWLAVGGPTDFAREAMARLEVIADTYLSVSTPVQAAAPTLLGLRGEVQSQIFARVRHNLAQLDTQIHRQNTCSRLEVEGGWYAVLRVPVTGSDEELALALLEQHSVLAHPGHFFDFQQEGYLVLSLIAPPADFAEGVMKILSR